MTRPRILPQSVQLVFEDRPLLRIFDIGGGCTDYELNSVQCLLLSKQALEALIATKAFS